jgi:signal transduction histidine kinase
MAFVISSRLKSAEKSFALVIGLAGWWTVTYGFELWSTSLSSMLFWLKLEYIGIAFLPPALIFFIKVFTSKQKFSGKFYHALIFVIPIITICFVGMDDVRHLYYKSLSLDQRGVFPTLKIEPSFWYYIFTIYFYAAIVWCIYSLITAFKRVEQLYRKQKNIILYALIVPWIFNILYRIGIGPDENVDLTPFAFIVTSTIISFGLLRYKLLDIIPASREKIFESMHDGVLVFDASDKVIDKNTQMESLLPALKNKIIGSDLVELFPYAKALHEAVLQRRKNTIEIEIEENGSINYFEVDINILSDRKADYGGCILIFNNITRQKKDAISLVALNELKDRLFSIIAHDLRSPLINVTEMVRLIDEQAITEEEFKLFLPELSKNLNYTSGLLDNLLHWSKSQLKGEVINPVRLDIRKIIQPEIAYCQQKATEKGIHLNSIIKDETFVFIDKEMIQLVVRNLIGNAIKYCSNEDHIIISCSNNSSSDVVVCFSDTGRGMKPETVEKLFMFQAFTTRGTNNEQGTGLGLQLCKDFIEKNNGKIWVTTEEGLGSKFYFSIPSALPVKKEKILNSHN